MVELEDFGFKGTTSGDQIKNNIFPVATKHIEDNKTYAVIIKLREIK